MTENKKDDQESTNAGGVSRRTVTKAMAWAVPAIAVAAPVPAFAGASQGILTLDGDGCKLPGNSNATFKGYAFNLNARNTTQNVFFCVDIVSVTLNNEDLGAATVINMTTCTNLGDPFCVPPGANFTELALLTANAASSSNGQLVVTYRVRTNVGSCVCDGFGPTMTVSTAINDAPPINGASCEAFSREEKQCLSGAVPPPAWQANTAYTVGTSVMLPGGEILTATVAGTSGGSAPVPPGPGNTVVDGTVTWEQL